jgi:hypothetical protein
MKKLIIAGLMLCLSSSLFALSEKWAACGFEWGNFFEKDGAYISSPGIDLSVYSFEDRKNIGMFVRASFLFPLNVDDFSLSEGMMMGVAFRLPLSERLNIHAGLAPQFIAMFGDSTGDDDISHSSMSFDLGIGADTGIKFDITDVIFINAGVELSYNFANYTSKTSVHRDGSAWTNTAGWAKDYAQFGARPYLTIGFNYYWATASYGKPPVVE